MSEPLPHSRFGYRLIIDARVHDCNDFEALARLLFEARQSGSSSVRARVRTSLTAQRDLDPAEIELLLELAARQAL